MPEEMELPEPMSYAEIVNTSLYDLLGDLGLTADSSINKYFTPYDPTIEESVKKIGELQGEQQRQSIGSNLESVRNVMGQTGLASSFTQNLAESSGLDMGRLELQDIRKSVGREIFKQQKKFAEDFYDTVLDLAQLGVSATADPVEIEKTKKKESKGIQLNLGEVK